MCTRMIDPSSRVRIVSEVRMNEALYRFRNMMGFYLFLIYYTDDGILLLGCILVRAWMANYLFYEHHHFANNNNGTNE